jgi:hypothetical protein
MRFNLGFSMDRMHAIYLLIEMASSCRLTRDSVNATRIKWRLRYILIGVALLCLEWYMHA